MSVRASAMGAVALWLAAACGSNPELLPSNEPVAGGASIGEPCAVSADCTGSLLCHGSVCVAPCTELAGNSCGREACLPSGLCSSGLGRDCGVDGDCGDGLVCSSLNRCAVPCEPGAEGVCKKDAVCRDDGTCPTDRDIVIGVGGEGNSPGTGGAPGCIEVDVSFEPQIPTVLLLIDRSASMRDEDGFGAAVKEAVDSGTYTLGDCPTNGDWRWNVVRDVLMNPEKGIVKPLEERVRFGMSLYSSSNGNENGATCPVLIDVPIALNNHQAMLDKFLCSDILDDTPTRESLLAAASTLSAFDEPGPKLIVLATDGEPDTCNCADPGGRPSIPQECREPGVFDQFQADVVATAREIYDQDITIHVINVSTPSNASLQQHLEDVAAAGGGEVYPGFSPGALAKAFEEIIDGVRSCVIDLDGEIAPGKESTGKVTLDGEPLTLDDPNGWQVNTPSQIELLGDACEAIKSGGHDLAISFPCESFDPVVH